MPPNVTQSFKLQRRNLESCRAEALLRLIIAEHCSTAVVPKLVRTIAQIKVVIMSYYPQKNFCISGPKLLLQ